MTSRAEVATGFLVSLVLLAFANVLIVAPMIASIEAAAEVPSNLPSIQDGTAPANNTTVAIATNQGNACVGLGSVIPGLDLLCGFTVNLLATNLPAAVGFGMIGLAATALIVTYLMGVAGVGTGGVGTSSGSAVPKVVAMVAYAMMLFGGISAAAALGAVPILSSIPVIGVPILALYLLVGVLATTHVALTYLAGTSAG